MCIHLCIDIVGIYLWAYSVCIHACIHIQVFPCLYVRMSKFCVKAYPCAFLYASIWLCFFICLCELCTSVYIPKCAGVPPHACMCTSTFLSVPMPLHALVCLCRSTSLYVPVLLCMRACAYVALHACMCICSSTCVHEHVHVLVLVLVQL